MTSAFNRLIVRNIVSPYGLALISYAIFLVAWVFPPEIYTQYMTEQDLMFLDPLTLLFFTGCVGAFLLGLRAFSFLAPIAPEKLTAVNRYRKPSLFYYLAPLFLGTILDCIRLIKLGGHVDFIGLIASQQGATLKQVLHSGTLEDSQWGLTLMVLTGSLWWALFRVKQFRLGGLDLWIFWAAFAVAFVVDVGTCIASLDRTSLMPLLAGIAVILLYGSMGGKQVRLSRLVSLAAAFSSGVIGLFLAIAFARGAQATDRLATSLIGYTFASYNRLTALLSGAMNYQWGGRGAYLFPYLVDSSTIHKLTGIAAKFGWPSSEQLWISEFASTLEAGLNGSYIWSGAFGYLYSDLGWFSLVYLFAVGIMTAYFWAKFRQGRTIGLVFYPWVAFCILFWLGWNPMFGGYFFTFTVTAAALAVYDFFLIGSAKEESFSPQIQVVQPREAVGHL